MEIMRDQESIIRPEGPIQFNPMAAPWDEYEQIGIAG